MKLVKAMEDKDKKELIEEECDKTMEEAKNLILSMKKDEIKNFIISICLDYF